MKSHISPNINTTDNSAISNDTALVVLIDHEQQILATSLDEQARSHISKLVAAANFSGAVVDTLVDYQFQAHGYQGLLLQGVGDLSKTTGTQLQKIASSIYKTLAKTKAAAAVLVENTLSQQQFAVFSLALLNASYRFSQYKTKKSQQILSEVHFITDNASLAAELAFVSATFTGQSLARDFGNQPPNVCYPAYMAEEAQKLAETYADCLSVEVLGEADMEKLGMGCFLSVSKGSEREGKLISFSYTGKGAKNTDAPIVLVGKGVTFDTGGISLKPGAGMEEMKFDMCGAASVFGTIRALCEAQLPVHVVGTMACAENMPSGKATRPGDIVTAMNGNTVEILNTDAEGRLVLSDALTYVEKYNPSVVINMATLTGACVIALGHVRTALYSADTDLAADLIAASTYSHDRVWHMPLDADYQEQLDSPVADIQNIGGRPAGSVTAACFLSRFTKNYRWAHLDIAGSAWVSGKNRNATGRPVPLLMQFVRSSLAD